jgi:hypothetical protein
VCASHNCSSRSRCARSHYSFSFFILFSLFFGRILLRVRKLHLHFQIKVREEPLLHFIFYFIFTFFWAYLIACARVASVLPDQGVRGDFFFLRGIFFYLLRVPGVAADLPANKLMKP